MKQTRFWGLLSALILGVLTGLWAGGGTGMNLSTSLVQAGEGLRALAVQGFWGNLAAWALVLALSALPLLLLVLPRGRGPLTGTDTLLPLSTLLLFLALFFAVNPTLLNSPLPEYWVLGAAGGALCAVVCWLVLRLLEPMDRRDLPALAALLALLLTACALLVALSAGYGSTAAFLAQAQTIQEGNTGAPDAAQTTIWIRGLLTLLNAIPTLLGSGVLLWGSDLARTMARGPFEEEALAQCEKTANGCRRVIQAAVLLSLGANLLQLVLSSALTSQSYTLSLPLSTLALAAALFLLCRCIQQGKSLLDDSRSII